MIQCFSWQVEHDAPAGDAASSADPRTPDTASPGRLWLGRAAGSAACPCPAHTAPPPGRCAGWAELRCRPAARTWTPLRPPGGWTWWLHGAWARRPPDQEESARRWRCATATGCPSGCVDWRGGTCRRLQSGQTVRQTNCAALFKNIYTHSHTKAE